MLLNGIREKISVITVFNREKGEPTIHKLKWNGRDYLITKLGYHHKVRDGRNIFHVFHVNNDSLAFKLQLDTETLSWWVLEVSDGNPN